MESILQESTGVRREVDMALTKAETDEHLGRVFRRAQQGIQMKGFRKGHVPVSLIQKLYGKDLEADAFEAAAQAAFESHVRETGVNPIGTPVVVKLDRTEDGGLAIKIVYEVLPEFELGEYKGLQVRRIFHTVTDTEIDDNLDRIREDFATYEPADYAADDGHSVTVDMQKIVDGTPIIGEGMKDTRIELRRSNLNPDLKAALLNTKVGDTFQIDLPTGEDGMNTYEVTVKEVQRMTLPDLDSDFAAKITGDPTATVETIREMARQGIASEYNRTFDRMVRDELVSKMVDLHEFEVPAALTKIVLDSFVEDMKRGSKKELPPDFNREAYDQEMRPVAERTARWMLIRDKIVDKEGLEAEEVDYEGLADMEAQRLGIGFDTLMKYFKNSPETHDRIIAEKVLQLLEDYAIVEEVEDITLPSPEPEPAAGE